MLWNGPVLELVRTLLAGLGAGHPRRAARLRRDARAAARRAAERQVGDALLDQRLVAGIGNIWRAEALWQARVSPWRTLAEVDDDGAAHDAPRRARADARVGRGARAPRQVYRRAGRACRRCGTPIRSAPQGEHARTAYWCPACQVGGSAPPS